VTGADDLAAALAFLGDALTIDRPLGPLCTYRVGGRARCFVEAGDAGTLARVGSALGSLAEPPPVLVVGRGSNLLVAEAGFDGVAVHLGEGLAEVRVHGHRVVAGGAASLPVVARRTVAESLSGFEWAVGVPGSIGGAVRMNAGGHGADMAASLVGVRLVDLHSGETRSMRLADLGLGYRTSRVAPQEVVVEAELLLGPGDRRQGEELISRIVRWRRDHQPGGQNAGSVFANPPGDSAGRLIDAAGCKGARVGTAEVSTKHANFIQADPGGSADDVFALMVEVARAVRDHSGVSLRPETRLVGFPPFEKAVG
jgi:UDP-N-acetylmuramate dehydrogenase